MTLTRLPVKKLVILETYSIYYVKISILLPYVQCKTENMKGMENDNDIAAAQANQTRGTYTWWDCYQD